MAFFYYSPTLTFIALKNAFYKLKFYRNIGGKKFVDFKEPCKPMCWHTLLFDPFLVMHINWAFFHFRMVVTDSFLNIYWILDNKAYVCVFVSVFSALIITWNRLEIGVSLELSSYLDCVWCDFCTWGNRKLKCLPNVSNVISKTKV